MKRTLITSFIALFVTGAFFLNAQTTINLSQQCDCEVFEGSTNPTNSPVVNPTGAEAGDLYINLATGNLFFWDGDSWEAGAQDHDWYTYGANTADPQNISDNIWTTGSVSFGNSTGVSGVGSFASGTYSMAGGTDNLVSANNAVAFGLSNNVTGNHSMALGSGNTVSGIRSTIGGQNNIVAANNSVAYGADNEITIEAPFSAVWGRGNTIMEGQSAAWGNGNTITATKSAAWGIRNLIANVNGVVFGEENFVSGAQSAAWGSQDTVTSNNAAAWGLGNHVSGAQAAAWGSDNKVSGVSSAAWGTSNSCEADNSVTFGTGNTVESTHHNSMAIGNGVATSAANQFFGRFAGGVNFYSSGGIGNGVVLAPGTSAWAAISDRRAKQKISNIQYGLQAILKMNPSEYYYNGQEKLSLGFIAQEMKEIIPDVVNVPVDTEVMMSIRYTELIPVLTKAIQEQQTQIEELKQQNIILREQISGFASIKKEVALIKAIIGANNHEKNQPNTSQE